MTSRTHDAFAFASLVTVAAFFPPEKLNLATLVLSIVATDVGALIPDMDQAGNRLWDLLPQGHFLARFLRRVFYKHRTLSHSVIGALALYKLLEWLLVKLINPAFIDSKLILFSLMIGYFSHLLADSFTEEGLPLFFPINITFGIPPIRSLRIKTGKWFEKIVVYPAIWIYLIWFINANRGDLIRVLQLVRS